MFELNSQLNENNVEHRLSPRHECSWKTLHTLRKQLNLECHKKSNSKHGEISKYLHIPEDRIVRYPLELWIKKLCTELSDISHKHIITNEKSLVNKLVTILNQSSFIISLMGDTQRAYQLCEETIHYYFTVYKKNSDNGIICQSIQPWINMARLGRILNNLDKSTHMFNFLSGQITPRNVSEKIVALALKKSFILKNIPYDVARRCHIVETVVNYLRQDAFVKIKELTISFNQGEMITNPSVAEANIVAEHHLKDFSSYENCLMNAYRNGRIQDLDIFSLRMAEYFYINDNRNDLLLVIENLHRYSCMLLEYETNKVENTHLVFTIAKAMINFGFRDDTYGLLLRILERYQQLNDEPGIINVLTLICAVQNKKSIYYLRLLKEYTQKTEYIYLKREKKISERLRSGGDQLLNEINRILSCHF